MNGSFLVSIFSSLFFYVFFFFDKGELIVFITTARSPVLSSHRVRPRRHQGRTNGAASRLIESRQLIVVVSDMLIPLAPVAIVITK